jgi:hypothetical protein
MTAVAAIIKLGIVLSGALVADKFVGLVVGTELTKFKMQERLIVREYPF